MQRFRGFPAGAVSSTPLPNLFFTGLLPQIDSLPELKVTLHAFWALYQKKGFPRYLTGQELRQDGTLLRSLRLDQRPPEVILREGLEQAVARGTLLHLTVELGGQPEDLYLLNTAKSREVLEKLRSGELEIGQVVLGQPSPPTPELSNIFTLYEQNIGLLTPIMAEELREAERIYPAQWIEEAFRLAVEYNKRNWRYIKRILERWAIEGKEDEKAGRGAEGLFTKGLGRRSAR